MKRKVNIGSKGFDFEYPDKCPLCHAYSEITCLKSVVGVDNDWVQLLFQCGFKECQSFFIGYYNGGPHLNRFRAFKPRVPNLSIFPVFIKELSGNFINIYKQAEEALSFGLDQIAGPGFRKAFEFLLKDYAKSIKPENIEECKRIEGMFSGKVVDEFISDERIKAVAKRALWLGNDESHYLKKWKEHDINDLTVLIKLTVDWLEIEKSSEKYIKDMPEKKQ